MKAMLCIFALIFLVLVPEIGLPIGVAWALWKLRKPLGWVLRNV